MCVRIIPFDTIFTKYHCQEIGSDAKEDVEKFQTLNQILAHFAFEIKEKVMKRRGRRNRIKT